MKKITRRTYICLILSLLLLIGTVTFIHRFFANGSSWASFSSNSHIYTDGQISAGSIYDIRGTRLASYDDGWHYSDDRDIRLGTIHAVGDPGGHIGTGALSAFASKLTGYNIITGTGVGTTSGRDLYLTIDAGLCGTARDALGDYDGLVGVYDYTTGRILCMVSSPAPDPYNQEEEAAEGSYINKFFSSTFIPGSTFKVVTATASLENLSGIWDRSFTCSGSVDIGGYKVTCGRAHGTLNISSALNESCNVTFGQLAVELGVNTMEKYVEKAGLTTRYDVNGIHTAASTFDFTADGLEGLAWSGIGQGKDLVNPCAMMVYMGAIANGGQAASPQILESVVMKNGLQTEGYSVRNTGTLIEPETAEALTAMMRDDVLENYGQDNFPGLEICAKSGTAQVSADAPSNGWFVGFLNDEEHPLAFVAMVEGGGYGARSAGKVINRVLQAAIDGGY